MESRSKRSSDGKRSRSGGRREKKRSNSNSSYSSSHGSHRDQNKRDVGLASTNRDSERWSERSVGAASDLSGYGSEDTEAGSHGPVEKARVAKQGESRRSRAKHAREHPGVKHPDKYTNHPALAIDKVNRSDIPGCGRNPVAPPSYYSPEIDIDGLDNDVVDEYAHMATYPYLQGDTTNYSYASGYSAHKNSRQ